MDILSVMFSQQTRKIGVIVPSVVISETHTDTSNITDHPVQQGATISDHAYDTPSEVTMSLGFAGGGSLLDVADTTKVFDISTGLSLGTNPREVYQQLLALKSSYKPFDVATGKRLYNNMLIQNMSVTTDQTSENVLSVTLTLREVMIVETSPNKTAPAENMKHSEDTAPVVNVGTKVTVKPSLPQRILDFVIERGKKWLGL
ncbi:phage baseplate protein [Photorhabdus viridis]|uniref:phage baseplate protein n=1 Tax=Photorhabdus viridis TaxID=3163327 RepID=UPI0033071E9B